MDRHGVTAEAHADVGSEADLEQICGALVDRRLEGHDRAWVRAPPSPKPLQANPCRRLFRSSGDMGDGGEDVLH
jgi:hypothetical protein